MYDYWITAVGELFDTAAIEARVRDWPFAVREGDAYFIPDDAAAKRHLQACLLNPHWNNYVFTWVVVTPERVAIGTNREWELATWLCEFATWVLANWKSEMLDLSSNRACEPAVFLPTQEEIAEVEWQRRQFEKEEEQGE